MSNTRVLFVDDDTSFLAMLKRNLTLMQNEWEMCFVSEPEQAVGLLKQKFFHAIVSDLMMPRIDGISLLNAVMKHTPDTVRIILSGTTDEELKRKAAAGASHQYLEKPLDITELKSTLQRSLSVCEVVNSKNLKGMVTKMNSLPSLSSLYLELVKEFQSENSKLSTIGKIISQDVGMTAKILQLVNSAYSGMRQRVSNVEHAARLLGLDTLQALVLTYDVFSQLGNLNLQSLSLSKLMQHSQKVASFARLIVLNENPQKTIANDAFVSGMLHDVGKIILAQNFPKQSAEILETSKYSKDPLWQIELEVFGSSHAEVGAYLLNLWHLPNPVIEAVAFHHYPSKCSHLMFSPLTAVHAANYMALENQTEQHRSNLNVLDEDYLEHINSASKFEDWREICFGIEEKENKKIAV